MNEAYLGLLEPRRLLLGVKSQFILIINCTLCNRFDMIGDRAGSMHLNSARAWRIVALSKPFSRVF